MIVVSDGVELDRKKKHCCLQLENVQHYKLGRNYGMMDGKLYFGQIALTTGCFFSETEFTLCLGDDDELRPGAGSIYRKHLRSDPSVDIWIPGLMYNNGRQACLEPDLIPGSVSHPCYRTKIFAFVPMFNDPAMNCFLHDFYHVEACVKAGWKVSWMKEVAILIRPRLPGDSGNGK